MLEVVVQSERLFSKLAGLPVVDVEVNPVAVGGVRVESVTELLPIFTEVVLFVLYEYGSVCSLVVNVTFHSFWLVVVDDDQFCGEKPPAGTVVAVGVGLPDEYICAVRPGTPLCGELPVNNVIPNSDALFPEIANSQCSPVRPPVYSRYYPKSNLIGLEL